MFEVLISFPDDVVAVGGTGRIVPEAKRRIAGRGE